MKAKVSPIERRRWPRLPLAIPVFIRSWSEGEEGRETLEFATALNVSAGGMLLVVRRAIPSVAQISLEIPSSPLSALAQLPQAARNLRAKVLRSELGPSYALIGLKFVRPLVTAERPDGVKLA